MLYVIRCVRHDGSEGFATRHNYGLTLHKQSSHARLYKFGKSAERSVEYIKRHYNFINVEILGVELASAPVAADGGAATKEG